MYINPLVKDNCRMAKLTTPQNLDPSDRDPATEREFEDAFRMMFEAPAGARPKAKNQEPNLDIS